MRRMGKWCGYLVSLEGRLVYVGGKMRGMGWDGFGFGRGNLYIVLRMFLRWELESVCFEIIWSANIVPYLAQKFLDFMN